MIKKFYLIRLDSCDVHSLR